MSHVLSMRTDFVEEWPAFKKLIHDMGHILQTSPKGHPEMAGVGTEYGWDDSRMVLCRNNDYVAKNLHKNMVSSFKVLTLTHTRKFFVSYHGHAGHDHPGPLLGAILGHCAIYTHPKAQPAALYCSLATWRILGQSAA
jgi:hypothetical protein